MLAFTGARSSHPLSQGLRVHRSRAGEEVVLVTRAVKANTPPSLLPCPWHAAGDVSRYPAGSVARPQLLMISRIQ